MNAHVQLRPLLSDEVRSVEQVREHYDIEKELAHRLRSASKDERRSLYMQLYDELFRRVPHHQMLTRKTLAEEVRIDLQRQLSFIRKTLVPDESFLELGAGDCRLTRLAAQQCLTAYALDVSRVIVEGDPLPGNCSFLLSTGCDIPLPDCKVDVAYSNQLMEHLHPDDAVEQLQSIYRVLKKGGRYVCVTPNRISGPWDISMYFDETATGFHLKEYSAAELDHTFRSAGFSRVDFYAGGRGFFLRVPYGLVRLAENLLLRLPYGIRCKIALTLPVRGLLGLRVIAYK